VPHRILIKGGLVLSMDPHIGELPVGDVLIEDGRIAAIGPAIDADAECVAVGSVIRPEDTEIGALCESGIRALYGHGTPAGLAWRSHDNPLPHPSAELRKLRETEFSSDDQLLGWRWRRAGRGRRPKRSLSETGHSPASSG